MAQRAELFGREFPESCAVCERRFHDETGPGKETWEAAEYKVFSIVEPYTKHHRAQGIEPFEVEAGYCSIECLQQHFKFEKTKVRRLLVLPQYVFRWVPREPSEKKLVVRHRNKPDEESIVA